MRFSSPKALSGERDEVLSRPRSLFRREEEQSAQGTCPHLLLRTLAQLRHMPPHLTIHNNREQLAHINNIALLRMSTHHSPPIPHLHPQNILSLPLKPSYNLIGR